MSSSSSEDKYWCHTCHSNVDSLTAEGLCGKCGGEFVEVIEEDDHPANFVAAPAAPSSSGNAAPEAAGRPSASSTPSSNPQQNPHYARAEALQRHHAQLQAQALLEAEFHAQARAQALAEANTVAQSDPQAHAEAMARAQRHAEAHARAQRAAQAHQAHQQAQNFNMSMQRMIQNLFGQMGQMGQAGQAGQVGGQTTNIQVGPLGFTMTFGGPIVLGAGNQAPRNQGNQPAANAGNQGNQGNQAGGNQGPGPMNFFQSIFQSFAQGQIGDYVFGERGLDDIITRLMEQERMRQSGRQLSEEAINALPKKSITETEVGNPCPICKDDFTIGEQATELPCHHLFHKDCIAPWLQVNGTCPVCRYDLHQKEETKPAENDHAESLD